MLGVLLLLLALSNAGKIAGEDSSGQCDLTVQKLRPRPHSVSILEFGAVGDGKTLNTIAFQNAIFYLKSFADKGGAQLYVPPGRWLTGSINLTSHLTLFLEKGASILASQDPSHWDIVEPLPSYGRGIELPGKRYRSLINGYKLIDVVVTGLNGTIDGQGSVWWDWFSSGSLNYSRPHIVEFIDSQNIVVSNLTFLNAPAYNIHPVYCSNVHIHNISVHTPSDSPFTVGIVPDSSDGVCIEDCSIRTGHDAISLKSGWDEYGIAYGRPTKDVHVRNAHLRSSSGASLSIGTEMSGGISAVRAERLDITDSLVAVGFSTAKGRGGFIRDVLISDLTLSNVGTAFVASGSSGSHPDDKFDPKAIPTVDRITISGVTGSGIGKAGKFVGIEESPFTSICLVDVELLLTSGSVVGSSAWECSNVSGSSDSVSPQPCPELDTMSSSCFSLSMKLGGKASSYSSSAL